MPLILLNGDENYFYCIQKAGLYSQSFDGRTGIDVARLHLLWHLQCV